MSLSVPLCISPRSSRLIQWLGIQARGVYSRCKRTLTLQGVCNPLWSSRCFVLYRDVTLGDALRATSMMSFFKVINLLPNSREDFNSVSNGLCIILEYYIPLKSCSSFRCSGDDHGLCFFFPLANVTCTSDPRVRCFAKVHWLLLLQYRCHRTHRVRVACSRPAGK